MIFLFYSLSLLNSMERRRILQKCSVYKLFEFQTLEFEKTDLLLLQPRNFDWLTFWIRNMSHLLLYRISCFYIKQQRTLNPNSFLGLAFKLTHLQFSSLHVNPEEWMTPKLFKSYTELTSLSRHSCVQNTFV